MTASSHGTISTKRCLRKTARCSVDVLISFGDPTIEGCDVASESQSTILLVGGLGSNNKPARSDQRIDFAMAGTENLRTSEGYPTCLNNVPRDAAGFQERGRAESETLKRWHSYGSCAFQPTAPSFQCALAMHFIWINVMATA